MLFCIYYIHGSLQKYCMILVFHQMNPKNASGNGAKDGIKMSKPKEMCEPEEIMKEYG